VKSAKSVVGRRLVLGAMAVRLGRWRDRPSSRPRGPTPASRLRYINPFPAGGATDTLSAPVLRQDVGADRPAMDRREQGRFGRQRRHGCARPVGARRLHAGLGGIASHAIAPTLYAKLPFNARTDFTFVSTMWQLAQHAGGQSRPARPRPVAELIELLKTKPGQVLVRLGRQRHDAASVGRAVQGDGQRST